MGASQSPTCPRVSLPAQHTLHLPTVACATITQPHRAPNILKHTHSLPISRCLCAQNPPAPVYMHYKPQYNHSHSLEYKNTPPTAPDNQTPKSSYPTKIHPTPYNPPMQTHKPFNNSQIHSNQTHILLNIRHNPQNPNITHTVPPQL